MCKRWYVWKRIKSIHVKWLIILNISIIMLAKLSVNCKYYIVSTLHNFGIMFVYKIFGIWFVAVMVYLFILSCFCCLVKTLRELRQDLEKVEHELSRRQAEVKCCYSLWYCTIISVLSGWRRGSVVRTSVIGLSLIYAWSTPDLWLTRDHFVGKVSALGQPNKPTQPSIPSVSVNE